MKNSIENMVLNRLDRQKKSFVVERRNKYGAKRCEIDGYKFASIKEATEYRNLKLELAAGSISDLEIHPTYPIIINEIEVCKVVLDFAYFDKRVGKKRYIDTKGFEIELSKLKKKLLEAQNNILVEWI